MKKKLVVSILSLSVMVLSAIPVLAATPTTEKSNPSGRGYAIVRDNDNAKIQLLASNKYIKNSDNTKVGYWIYGKRDGNVVSEYKVYVGEGRASVTNGEGYYDDGGWVEVESWSKAAQPWTSKGTNKAYYDYR